MLGVIIYNLQYKDDPVWKHQIQNYCESFYKVGIRVVPMDHVSAYMNVIAKKAKFNFAIFYDKDVELAKYFEDHKIKVFNSSEAIENADDKARTYLILEKNDLPTLPTFIIPNFYYSGLKNYLGEIEFCLERLNFSYPVLLKPRKSSFGEGIMIAENKEDLEEKLCKNYSQKYIIQKFVQPSLMVGAIDYRVIVVNNKPVCCVKRVNHEDFRCNSKFGSEWYELRNAPGGIKEIACKVSKKMNLDYCAVDFVNDNGKYCVIDVNSNMLTQKIQEVCDVNITDRIAKSISKKI